MPFTVSHAVVALPFVRTPLAPAAVAVGAMTPDLPLFLSGTPLTYDVTHSVAWIPLTVLVALALLLVWRCVLRPAARELSPGWLAARLSPAWDAPPGAGARETFALRGRGRPSWQGAVLLVLALAIGVASHIAWDWFTHEGRVGTEALPVLDVAWGPLPGYKWLQYGSSVAGLVVLAVWALVRLGRAPVAVPSRALPGWVRVVWWLSLPVTLVAALLIGMAAFGPFTADFTPQHLAYRILPPACGLWGAATLVLCLVVPVLVRSRTSR